MISFGCSTIQNTRLGGVWAKFHLYYYIMKTPHLWRAVLTLLEGSGHLEDAELSSQSRKTHRIGYDIELVCAGDIIAGQKRGF